MGRARGDRTVDITGCLLAFPDNEAVMRSGWGRPSFGIRPSIFQAGIVSADEP